MARKTAGYSARLAGRALSEHVLPDNLIPSWKTRKAVSTGLSLLKPKKKKKPAYTKPSPGSKRPPLRPAARPPKQKHDKNAWLRGDNLQSAEFSEKRPQSLPKSSLPSSRPLRQSFAKVRDVIRNPRLVAQMKLDELDYDYQTKRRHFLSDLREARAKFPF